MNFFLFSNLKSFAQSTDSSTLIITGAYSTGNEKTDPKQPHNIFISNISTTSFTVNWVTNEPTKGNVIFAKNSQTLTKKSLDKRDVPNAENKRYTHMVDITDTSFSSSDIVYFKFLSDDVEKSDNGSNFQFKPPAALSTPPTPTSQDGKITPEFTSNATNRDFIVAVQIGDNSTWVSSVPAAGTNTWNLPLGGALTTDMKNYASSAGKLNIKVYGEKGSTASQSVDRSDNPIDIAIKLPLVTITPSPTSSPSATPTAVKTPTPTPVVANLPKTGVGDYFPLLTALAILGVGVWFFKMSRNKQEDFIQIS